jgi:sugar transferase EpsL
LLKRTCDILFALLLLVPLAPFMLLVAAIVRLTLGSPVFFRQIRPGLHGRLFSIWKFRTMRDLRDANGEPLPDAERMAPTGIVLRKLRLDELPELWHLLSGEMSLIGPRPLLPKYLDEFTPFEARRHEVPPGITGWAQVNGNTVLSLPEKALLDVWYIDHWTPWLDVMILCKTLLVVLAGEHADPGALVEAREYADRVSGSGAQHLGRVGDTG